LVADKGLGAFPLRPNQGKQSKTHEKDYRRLLRGGIASRACGVADPERTGARERARGEGIGEKADAAKDRIERREIVEAKEGARLILVNNAGSGVGDGTRRSKTLRNCLRGLPTGVSVEIWSMRRRAGVFDEYGDLRRRWKNWASGRFITSR